MHTVHTDTKNWAALRQCARMCVNPPDDKNDITRTVCGPCGTWAAEIYFGLYT